MNPLLDELKSALDYDPAKGCFYWKIKRGKAEIGAIAGNLSHHGYYRICFNQISYQVHRLVWLFETGDFPVFQIDHKDRVRANNVFSNLRQATNAENHWNLEARSNNSTGFRGIHFHKKRKRYNVLVAKHKKRYFVGSFEGIEEAISAWNGKAKELHGEFFRPQGFKTLQAG